MMGRTAEISPIDLLLRSRENAALVVGDELLHWSAELAAFAAGDPASVLWPLDESAAIVIGAARVAAALLNPVFDRRDSVRGASVILLGVAAASPAPFVQTRVVAARLGAGSSIACGIRSGFVTATSECGLDFVEFPVPQSGLRLSA